jgi:NADH-quinone oxidoreductase subunit M
MSIFLSGVLVKLSVFGILRVLDFFFFKLTLTVFYYLSLLGVVDSTLKMFIQIDSKVVVAFSTTVQMNFILFILFSKSGYSELPLTLGLINHFLTASLLFFTCDVILVRLNTREFFFLSGLYFFVPVFSFFLLFTMVNQINFPGFLGFLLDVTFLVDVVPSGAASGTILFFFLFVFEHLYIFFFFLKIAFGASNRLNFFYLRDLGFNENALYVYLLSVSVFFGVFPESVNTFFFF